MRQRLEPNDRRESLLLAALALAEAEGYGKVNRSSVAERAGVSPGIVSHYFGDVRNLREAVMERAIIDRCMPVIADGLAVSDGTALAAPIHVRRLAKTALGARSIEASIARTWKPTLGTATD